MTDLDLPVLGRWGVWRRGTEIGADLAQHLEALGFGAIWVGSSPPADLDHVEQLIAATHEIVVATGIVNIWAADPHQVARSFHRIEERHPGRLLLGLGVGHPEAQGEQAKTPYSAMVRYLDVLDGAGVPASRIVLAALGPRMLRLARDRTAGAHPYLVTPEHTAEASAILGPGRILAPEQRLVLSDDTETFRRVGRDSLTNYLRMSNYLRNFERLGFDDDDFADGGSDRLVDALVVHGTDAQVVSGLQAHIEAGANHVAAQVLTAPGDDVRDAYTRLATALGLTSRRI